MRRPRNIAFVVMIFLIPYLSLSQGNLLPIDYIQYTGLQKTRASHIDNILKLQNGDHPTSEDIQSELQRLKNTVGIGDATVAIDTIDEKIHLNYRIEEIRTLLPIFNFGGIRDNLWFQLGFTDDNWWGKGQNLLASYQNNDGFHTGQIYFRAPRIKGGNWGYSASLSKWTSLEPLFFEEGAVDYVYENNSIALSGIKYFGDHNSLELGGNYFIEKYAKSENQELENPPGPEALTQPKFLSKIELSQNYLNYDFFYLSGYIWQLAYQNVFNSVDNSIFNSVQFQGIKYYRPTNKINLAFRLKLAVSTNNDTPFAPFVADSHVNLRGVGNRIDRGTAQAVLNAEYRHTIFAKKRWSSQIVVFSDIGTWRNPGGEFKDLLNPDQFRQFIGGGFRLIYQKVLNAVIRIDYGIDVFNPSQRGFVFGLGQYF